MLSACTKHASFSPDGDMLRNAILGKTYNEKVNISGGAVYALDFNGMERFVGDITPNDDGLYLQYCDDSPGKNCVQVQGKPTKVGIIKVHLYGGLFGTNISVGSEFDKTYTIEVKSPNQ